MIDRFIDEGRTLLFVSHDLNSVKRLCNRAQLLEQGRCLYAGNPNTVVNLYTKLLASDTGAAAIAADVARLTTQGEPPKEESARPPDGVDRILSRPVEVPLPVETDALRARLKELQETLEDIAAAARTDDRAPALIESERAQQRPMGTEYCYGGELGEIVHPSIKGADDGILKSVFTSGEMVEVSYQARSREYLSDPIYALTIKNAQGQEIYGTNTFFGGNQPAPAISPGDEVDVCFRFPLNLIAGEYFISLGWTHFYRNRTRGDPPPLRHLQDHGSWGRSRFWHRPSLCVDCGSPQDPARTMIPPSIRVILGETNHELQPDLPVGLSSGTVYRDAPDSLLETIKAEIDAGTPWRQAARKHLASVNPWLLRVVTDPTRTNWLERHPPRPDTWILDVGSGWGQWAIPAATVAKVVALEPNPTRLATIQSIARQEGVAERMYFISAPLGSVSFPNQRFDSIYCIGVLEWVPRFEPEGDPIAIQRGFLRRLRGLLSEEE